MNRTLVLRREHLTALTPDDLATVAGGVPPEPPSYSNYCVTGPQICDLRTNTHLCP